MTFVFTGEPQKILETFCSNRGLARFNTKIMKAEQDSAANFEQVTLLKDLYNSHPAPSIGQRRTLATALKRDDLLLLDKLNIYADALGIQILSTFGEDFHLDILSATAARRSELRRDIAEQIEWHSLLHPEDEPIAHGEVTTLVIEPFDHFARRMANLSFERAEVALGRLHLAGGSYIAPRQPFVNSDLLAVRMQSGDQSKWFYFQNRNGRLTDLGDPIGFEPENDRDIALLVEIGYEVMRLESEERLDPDMLLRHAVQNHFKTPPIADDLGQARGIA